MDDRRTMSPLCPRLSFRLWLFSLLLAAFAAAVPAAEVHLKNGDILEGKPVPIQSMNRPEIERENAPSNRYYPILMVHSGIKRYFVPSKQVVNIDHAAGVLNLEEYEIAQILGARRRMLSALGRVQIHKDFDEFGRRTISFRVNGEKKDVVQGITKINPRYVTVTAMKDYDWEHKIAITSLEEETLNAVLRQAIDEKDPQARMGLAVFYMQSGLYVRAGNELDSIVRDFPDLKDTAGEIIRQLRSTQAQQLLSDLRRRRDNGQYRLAALALDRFPKKNMSADVLKDLEDLERELETRRNDLDRVRLSLVMLQRGITDEAKRSRLESLRSAVRDELDLAGLERMQAFLKLENDGSLSTEQKLALAYSGWMLGSAHAVTDLDQTLRYWQARHLMEETLVTDNENQRQSSLAQLQNVEGISPEIVERMLQQIKPVIETPGIRRGVPHRIEVPSGDSEIPIVYHVLLPHEYSPNRAYPMVVSLHPLERSPNAELAWWGGTEKEPGQSQRHGYIVIAPEYIDPALDEYDYDAKSHYITLMALRDCRRRFHVDSDRVFLAGHGAGGDAAFDIGMSHPDLFAGVIPIAGLAKHYCKWYWQNAKHVPFYLVSGELCRASLVDPDHSVVLGGMLRRGHEFDLTYAEFVGRGYEHYYEEIHHLFDWMNRLTRAKNVLNVEATILRPVDNQFYWIKADGFPANVVQAAVIDNGGRRARVRPMKLEAGILDGSDDHTTISIRSGAKRHVLKLAPSLIDYNKRLWVRFGSSREFNDFPEPSIATMLDDFRKRGDRQNLVWTEITIE